MSQKPDYYAILGVEKTASEADIKKAFMRITMTCHPDGAPYKKLDDAQKAEADEKFKYGKEAQAVLTDPVKRTAYDKFGHAGLDSMKGQTSGGTDQNASSSGTPRPVRTRSNEEVFDYFDRAAHRNGDAPKQATDTAASGSDVSEEDMRRAAAEARRRNRGQNADNGSFSAPPPVREEPKAAPAAETATEKPAAKPAEKPAAVSSPVSAIFDTVAGKMSDAADRLRSAAKADAPVPVEALEKFRDSLGDLIGEVDDAIRTARRNPPRGGYNR